jgi:hypothetical protein
LAAAFGANRRASHVPSPGVLCWNMRTHSEAAIFM